LQAQVYAKSAPLAGFLAQKSLCALSDPAACD